VCILYFCYTIRTFESDGFSCQFIDATLHTKDCPAVSTARPPVFMIYTSLAWILIIIWKPYRSILTLLTIYWTSWMVITICIGIIDKWIQEMSRQDTIFGGLSIGQFGNYCIWGRKRNYTRTDQMLWDLKNTIIDSSNNIWKSTI